MIIELISDRINVDIIYVVTTDVEKTWEDFCSNFKLVKAAGGIVKNKEGEYLFIKRRGKWDLPKGKCEKNEEIEKCAQREIGEECGISGLILKKKIIDTFHTYQLKNRLILKKTSWYEYDYSGNEQPVPQTEEDITDIEWMRTENLKTITENTFPSIIEVMKRSNLSV